jgi:hypothetical protein
MDEVLAIALTPAVKKQPEARPDDSPRPRFSLA